MFPVRPEGRARRGLPLSGAVAAALTLSLSPSALAADTALEAESLRPASRDVANVQKDRNASGGKALVYWLSGSASRSLSTPAFSQIAVRVRGDQCAGAPRMVVKVDGTQVISTEVPETGYAEKSGAVSRAAGTHRVEVAFTNNHRTSSSCDRNLRVDRIVLREAAAAPAPAPEPAPLPEPEPEPAPSTGTAPSSWTWSGNFDTATTTQYYQLLTPTQGRRVSFVSAPALQGSAVKMELRPGDTAGYTSAYPNSASSDGANRNQFRAINGPDGKKLWAKGDDVYFRFAVNVDPTTTIGSSISNPWRVLAAFPSVEDGAFSPLKIGLQREANGGANPSGTDALVINGDLGNSGEWDTTQWRLQNPQKGAWYEFIVHIRFSDSSTDGLWEFWLKQPGESGFVKQTFNAGALSGQSTARLRTLSGATHRSNLRLGIYRNAKFTTDDTIYFDNVYWSTSLAAAIGA